MNARTEGHITLRIHGIKTDEGQSKPVDGLVFASKLGTMIRAMRAADRAKSGDARFNYAIHDLKPTSALVELIEVPVKGDFLSTSSVASFSECIFAIQDGRADAALKYGTCAHYVSQLASGSGSRFGYGEILANGFEPIRVDNFLQERTRTIVEKAKEQSQEWFQGVAFGSFDGRVEEVDLRGSLPQIKLLLSAGGREIDCVLRNFSTDEIRLMLGHRVRLSGRAFYDGREGLPVRIAVSSADAVRVIDGGQDFTRWRGAFEGISPDEWDDGE